MSSLRSFLQTIDPDTTIYETESRADTAFNSFNPGSWTINNHDEFLSCLSRFYWHVDSHILGISHVRDSNSEFTKGSARNVLTELYGGRGEVVAFEMASQGIEGGLYRVLKDFASQRARHYINNGISSRVSAYLNGLSSDEQTRAAEEYVRDYGHLLPDDITQDGAWRVKASFHSILSEHPNLISRMRQIGRS